MEVPSQPSEVDRRKAWTDLYIKAIESKNDSVEAAHSAYKEIIGEANSLNSDCLEVLMDYKILGVMIRKNREALERDRGGLFDNEQFAALIGCTNFKLDYNGDWCKNQGVNWVKFGEKYTHLIATPKALDFIKVSFDDSNIKTEDYEIQQALRMSKSEFVSSKLFSN